MAGRQLSRGLRRDLDEVAEQSGISLVSCRRQFDNLKRVFKAVEDVPGRLIDNISRAFALNGTLAESYARLVFICNNRLAVDKRPLQHLQLSDF
eukprot:UC1_evm1s1427